MLVGVAEHRGDDGCWCLKNELAQCSGCLEQLLRRPKKRHPIREVQPRGTRKPLLLTRHRSLSVLRIWREVFASNANEAVSALISGASSTDPASRASSTSVSSSHHDPQLTAGFSPVSVAISLSRQCASDAICGAYRIRRKGAVAFSSILRRWHLLDSLQEFEQFYNSHRPHQGIANTRPLRSPALADHRADADH
jgi:hypothetical protein